ncbi:putative alkyl sulfatase [Pontimonas salivibrio]|uniref:Putative alkyl sulfatase n=1 Tax=Pontimonas salivibrio TaxID=1159327 RepID=A0A2L2BN53_9MICO|nr:sterol carrier family protein [Pontimonas salivibrio]AVG23091.1 putative alkyl sulfatase [Pontimonas salivibrio]
MSRRKIPDTEGMQAVNAWSAGGHGSELDPDVLALAVRYTLQVLQVRAPGRSVEIRVPPFGAAQIVEGTRHTRGTPPATVELSPDAFLQLATGQAHWSQLSEAGAIQASGERSDLREFFPLWRLG